MTKVSTVFLDIRGSNRLSAHLFEHVFIRGFYKYLEQNGINPYLIGWLSADCFDEFLFIEYGFYQAKVERLFKKYLSTPLPFNSEIITSELAVIEAENAKSIAVNHSDLLKNLSDLQSRPWNRLLTVTKSNRQLNISSKPQKIINFSLKLSLKTDDLALKQLFLRAFIFFSDIAALALRQQFSAYPTDNSIVMIEPNQPNLAYCLINFVVRATNYNKIAMQKFITETLANFDFVSEQTALKAHFDFFQTEPFLQRLRIDRYRYSGINIDNQSIAKLYTLERLQQIQKHLEIKITKI